MIDYSMALAVSLSISTFAEQAREKKAPPDAAPNSNGKRRAAISDGYK
jgi:hypothetical protein